MNYVLSEHPYHKETGKHLKLENGELWSLVDLSRYPDGKGGNSENLMIRDLYEKMGGHYEAALITEKGVDGDSIFRGRSIEELVTNIVSLHEEYHPHSEEETEDWFHPSEPDYDSIAKDENRGI